jgi:hypothetical protein
VKNQLVFLDTANNDRFFAGFDQIVVDEMPAAAGTLEVLGKGQFKYAPATDYVGITSFTYRYVNELGVTSNLATVQIGVAATTKQNPWWNLDVDNTGIVTPSDALKIINLLNDPDSVRSVGDAPAASPFLDVNGDGRYSPSDALLIINYLIDNSGGEGESNAQIPNDQQFLAVDLPDLNRSESASKKRNRAIAPRTFVPEKFCS